MLRILDKEGAVVDLDQLGFEPERLERFERAFRKPHGAVLVTGPTGSGKTTTLYGALRVLHTPEKNIITIEDPVEYELAGHQADAGQPARRASTFAGGLRSMMRADPDVIMVGEIRDRETAQIAVEAALTGHLVLSTLHTNDAPSAIARLIDMGVEPFLVATRRRLRRRPAPGARAVRALQAAGVPSTATSCARTASTSTTTVDGFEPVGCPRCGGTGYKGRVGLYEVMPVTEEIRQLAVARASAGRDRRGSPCAQGHAPPARGRHGQGPRRA